MKDGYRPKTFSTGRIFWLKNWDDYYFSEILLLFFFCFSYAHFAQSIAGGKSVKSKTYRRNKRGFLVEELLFQESKEEKARDLSYLRQSYLKDRNQGV